MFSVWLLQLDTMRHSNMNDEGLKKKTQKTDKTQHPKNNNNNNKTIKIDEEKAK